MLNKIFAIIVFICLGSALQAQQQGQYSQYMMNYYLVNPAVAGTDDQIDIRLGARAQWVGLSGAPRNYYVSGHFPINKVHAKVMKQRRKPDAYHVIGGIASGQTLGAISHNTAYLSYAYHLPLSVNWIMSMGIMAGMNQFSIDGSALNFGDNVPDQAANATLNKTKFDGALGIWLYSDKIFLGLSSMQIMQNKIDFNETMTTQGKGMLNRHFILTGGYKIRLNEDLKVIPSLLIKQTSTAFQMDINTKVRYRDLFWAGMSYRHVDAMVFLAGVGIPLSAPRKGSGVGGNGHGNNSRLEIGYSYDLTTSKLRGFSGGSHEIMIGLVLPMGGGVICPSNYW